MISCKLILQPSHELYSRLQMTATYFSLCFISATPCNALFSEAGLSLISEVLAISHIVPVVPGPGIA